MPVYELNDDILFPPVSHAEEDGLLAIGGDLSPERILTAYSQGIFPWFTDEQPILWWFTNPRAILIPGTFKATKSLRQNIRNKNFSFSFDKDFEAVIENCSKVNRKNQEGTWITKDMINAYTDLHKAGYAHSMETWRDGKLVGGLYGLSLGKAFYGESMFHFETDASKAALFALSEQLKCWNFKIIDIQQKTDHLFRYGAQEISSDIFLKKLEAAQKWPSCRGKWMLELDHSQFC